MQEEQDCVVDLTFANGPVLCDVEATPKAMDGALIVSVESSDLVDKPNICATDKSTYGSVSIRESASLDNGIVDEVSQI